MTLYQKTIDLIKHSQSDDHVGGVPTGLPKLDDLLHGIRQGTYYLYGAETGIGKTTFVRELHIHKMYDFYKRINDPSRFDLYIVDISLEISDVMNNIAAMTRYMFINHNKVIPVGEFLRWDRKKRLPPEILEHLELPEVKEYFEHLESKMVIVNESITPGLFHDVLLEVARKFGTFTKEARWITECGEWIPHNPNLYIQIIIDTVNIADLDASSDTIKAVIDRISRTSVYFRNKCNFIFAFIQQFNAEISDTARREGRRTVKTPQLRDFEDSKRTTKDANIIIGLYEPFRHLDLDSDKGMFKGYDIKILKSWIRTAHVLKYRNGPSNTYIPLKFDGALGMFTELPDPEQMTPQQYVLATRHA